MTEQQAMNWIETCPGLSVIVGKNRAVTLTDGSTVEVEGIGIVDAVNKLQEVLLIMRNKKTTTVCTAKKQ